MSRDDPAAFRRYLAAKRTVDDRALHPGVLGTVAEHLASRNGTPRVLELGAGIGTMIPRILGLGDRPLDVEYTAVDRDAELLATIPDVLASWRPDADPVIDDDAVHLTDRGGRRATIERVAGDVRAVMDRDPGPYDLVIAAAFMDLVEIGDVLPRIFSCLGPDGLAYFPITFDGSTVLEPAIDPELDRRVVDLYHASMRGAGTDRAGRALIRGVDAVGGSVIDAGGSDWVVIPGSEGYPADEAYFLHYLLGTIEGELAGHPDLDDGRFGAWVGDRHDQVESGGLTFVAHNLDVVAGRG